MSEVRKRALDEDSNNHDEDDQSTKRVAKEELHNIENVMVMKLLCPSSIIGAIIGRGGNVLHGLQTESNSKIRISQNTDFFPGTNDRVIAITGQPSEVTTGMSVVVEKMCEAIDSLDAKRADAGGSSSLYDPHSSSAGGTPRFTLRVLIPHAASGVVIGRAGANIKEISTLTNTRLQLSDASDPFQTKERLVTITGSESVKVRDAAIQVLGVLLENRNVGNFLNVTPSYPQSAALAPPPPLSAMRGGQAAPMGQPQYQYMGGAPLSTGFGGGYQQQQPQQYQQQSSQLQQAPYNPAPGQALAPTHYYASAQGQPSRGVASSMGYPHVPHASSVPQTPAVLTQIGVPDQTVGAIVGKGGLVLKGIMASTGAFIKVSQKGEYIPGSLSDRIITIEGTQQQVHFAHAAIMTQIANHKAKMGAY